MILSLSVAIWSFVSFLVLLGNVTHVESVYGKGQLSALEGLPQLISAGCFVYLT